MNTSELFAKFHSENPFIYHLFEKQAFRAINAGHKKLGSKNIIEYLRWECSFTNKDNNKPFKINNIFTPYYSRMFA